MATYKVTDKAKKNVTSQITGGNGLFAFHTGGKHRMATQQELKWFHETYPHLGWVELAEDKKKTEPKEEPKEGE